MEQKFAILADIHANYEALTTVIADAHSEGVTDFICLGDVVGYNANPHECIELIREIGAETIRGNHDHYCSHTEETLDDFQPAAATVVDWTRRQLSSDDIKWLRGLPYSKVTHGFTIVHGTLDGPENWGYVFDMYDAENHLAYQATTLCFHGHTHVPVVFEKQGTAPVILIERPTFFKVRFGSKYFANIGSVGQPRDGDPRASYVIFNPKAKEVEYRRLQYDVETTAAKVRAAGLPDRLADRLFAGR